MSQSTLGLDIGGLGTTLNSHQLQEITVTSFFSLNQFFSNHLKSLSGSRVFLEAPSQFLAFVFLEIFSL